MPSDTPLRVSSRRSGGRTKQAGGVVTKCSSRVAKSGSQAHSFYIGDQKFSIFTADELSPVVDGDRVHFGFEVRRLRTGHRSEYNVILQDTLIVEVPAELEAEVAGEVYVLSNPSMQGLLKVGYTTGTALKRASELSGVTGVPTGFKVEWALPVIGDARAVEQRAHAHLVSYKAGKEFFKVSLDDAKAAVVQSFAELYPERAMLMDQAFSRRAEAELSRRADLAQQAERRAREKEEEEARKQFEQSLEGRWRKEGKCRMVIRPFNSEPNRNFPSFWGKLTRVRYDDYLEFKLSPGQEKGEVIWVLAISGRINEKSVWKTESFPTKQDAFDGMARAVKAHGVENHSIAVEVSNAMIETPLPLPQNVYKPGYVLEVSSIDHFVILPVPTPVRRSRFSQ
ncbi:GIY-YIG nuclease family protein [Rhizobium leguminosarum]|uniref:GIY-YIG nuclease family protein n=1 Tax=Rhizobium leguminosarum TaxID=384 RepID=UPI001C95ABFC|nr:GIY-YIG nuclease family protein [Rhizobium leguminosarum]MBY5635925.1 GIY-YIG nuclease family protein [Rhizobium leguminosarum]